MYEYKGQKVRMVKANYSENGRLAVLMILNDGEIYDHVTTNIMYPLADDSGRCAFIDTNNMGEDIVQWLVDNELGVLTQRVGTSGYCLYPEFRFNTDKLEVYA